jgi:hypothetical protein
MRNSEAAALLDLLQRTLGDINGPATLDLLDELNDLHPFNLIHRFVAEFREDMYTVVREVKPDLRNTVPVLDPTKRHKLCSWKNFGQAIHRCSN